MFALNGVNDPGIERVALRYQKLRSTWGNDRVAKLCRSIGKPLNSVCFVAGMAKVDPKTGRVRPNIKQILACWKSGEWPTSALILFEVMESQARIAGK